MTLDVEALMSFVNAKCNDDARRQGVMTLGALRDGLSVVPTETPVVFADGGTPGALSSYRGYYDRLAIQPSDGRPSCTETALEGGGPAFESEWTGHYEPGADEVRIATPCTAGELIKALNIADGEAFEGYKGGQFAMDAFTFMHVAEYGRTGEYVSALRVETDRVVIESSVEEF